MEPPRQPRSEQEAEVDDDGPRKKRPSPALDEDEENRPRKKKKKSEQKKSSGRIPLILGLSGGGVALVVLAITAFVWPGFLLSSGSKGGPKGPGGVDKKGGPSDTAKVWEPDPTFLDKLTPARQVGNFDIRIPKEYEFMEGPAQTGIKLHVWTGKSRPDESLPQLTITLVTPPPGETATLEEFLTSIAGGVQRRRTNWSQTATERGKVNGLEFLRVRWSGREKIKGANMHGFIYVAQDGSNFIQLSSQDIEPHHEQSLQLAEAATLTIKKR